jgi:hypothetical protein
MDAIGPPGTGSGTTPPDRPDDDFADDDFADGDEWEWDAQAYREEQARRQAADEAYALNYNAAVEWLRRQGWEEREAELFVQNWESRARGRGLTRGMPRYWSALREAAPSRSERIAVVAEEPARAPTPFRWQQGHGLRRVSSGQVGIVMSLHGPRTTPHSLFVEFEDGTTAYVLPEDAEHVPEPPRERPYR